MVGSDPNTHLLIGTTDNRLAAFDDFKAVTLDKPFVMYKNVGSLFKGRMHEWKNTSYGGTTAEFYPAASTLFRMNGYGFTGG